MSWVAPPPKLPQPPDTPFAVPTTWEENIELIQNWVETKVASEKPVKKRTRRKETAELITAVQNTTGAVASMSEAVASRGPKKVTRGSHDYPGKHGTGNRRDAGVTDVRGGEVEVVADDREQRRGSERREEAAEEGEPGEVERPHVRRRCREEAEFGRLVFGVYWDGKFLWVGSW